MSKIGEMLVPMPYEVDKSVEWFFDHCMASAFFNPEDKRKALKLMFEEAIMKTQASERRKIEEYVYNHPECVDELNRQWDTRYAFLGKKRAGA